MIRSRLRRPRGGAVQSWDVGGAGRSFRSVAGSAVRELVLRGVDISRVWRMTGDVGDGGGWLRWDREGKYRIIHIYWTISVTGILVLLFGEDRTMSYERMGRWFGYQEQNVYTP
jgi:hypothetical protein